jgi:serine/threonine protein kinase/tetratricopeptide (TPR) repeat protein
MKCLKCKTVNPDDNLYCGKCGTPLIDIPEPFTTTITKNNSKEQTLDFVPGQFFGERYQIIEEIGRGGMGRVYKAIDKELSRIVVLKMIRPERSSDPGMVERFKKEINLASQITHENVCRIYDLGEIDEIKYISMQFIDGENLKDFIQTSKRLSIESTIDISRQVCQALIAAHKKGVIHRDLKPKNIMLDKKGTAFVMDFGIAKSIDSEDTIKPGAIVGTPYYMSPEQAIGEQIDHRADIYSLGAIMYEMLTGKPPFQADTIAGMIHKHVNETPKPISQLNPQTPVELEKIIMKCLEKKPDKRYQGINEIMDSLNRVESEIVVPAKSKKIHWKQFAPLVAVFLIIMIIVFSYLFKNKIKLDSSLKSDQMQSIVVLPFEDLSSKKDQQYICYGMCQDIIVKLSQINGLKVIPATLETLDREKNIFEIAKERGWFAILHGSFRKEKDNIRITPLLTKVDDESIIWSKIYNRKRERAFEVEDDIARTIAEALKVEVLPDTFTVPKSREPRNVEAYEYYLKGRKYIEEKYSIYRREEDFETAMRMYEKAIEIDPNYALTYWGLGDAYTQHFLKTKNEKDFDLTLRYLQKAYELDPNLAEANVSLGWAYFYKDNYDSAYQSFKRALEIAPEKEPITFNVGSFLRSIGLYCKAIDYYSKAIESNPLDTWLYVLLADCFLSIGEFEKSDIYFNKGLEIEPKNLTLNLRYAINFIWLKKFDEAKELLIKAEKIAPNNPRIQLYQALLYAAKGEKEKSFAFISKDVDPYLKEVTSIYSLLGMNDEAIKYINEGIDKSLKYKLTYYYSYPFLINNPCYNNLHDDPRFKKIVKEEKKKYEEKLKKYGSL